MQIERHVDEGLLDRALGMAPEGIIDRIKASGLKGRGGAGFPTGLKWGMTGKSPEKRRILVCNADEGEPGTFKDKFILENNPSLFVQGVIIAAYAIGADRAYIYLRGEYFEIKGDLENVIRGYADRLERIGLSVTVVPGAGAYICGDETAIMNSIEGKRGEPRAKPPYPTDKGLYGLPTVINNVETLANVPLILEGGWQDLNLISISGDVAEPGVYEAPLGTTLGELMQKAKPREEVKAIFLGAAGGCIPYMPETRLDKETLAGMGAMLGSCTLIVVGKSRSILGMCRNIGQFFVHESCGRCVPCREGNPRVLAILDRISGKTATPDDRDDLRRLAEYITAASFCGLGMASNKHLLTAMKYFPEEFA